MTGAKGIKPDLVIIDDVQKMRRVLDGHHYVDCECGAEVRIPIGSDGFHCPACGYWAKKEDSDGRRTG